MSNQSLKRAHLTYIYTINTPNNKNKNDFKIFKKSTMVEATLLLIII